MRVVGSRKIRSLQFHASSALFLEGCKFNEQIHKLPTGDDTCILKGLYRFKTHEQANQHWDKCLAEKMSSRVMGGE